MSQDANSFMWESAKSFAAYSDEHGISRWSKRVLFLANNLTKAQVNDFTCFKQCKVFMAEATAKFPLLFVMIDYQRIPAESWFSHLNLKTVLFQNPFATDAFTYPDELQVKIIKLQANDHLRDKFNEGLVFFN
ncbi:hypothetical protein TNIN_409821 [Trichonephila inaurata madagascariensis]|uniref:Uncharacterized protein n=1 Tax=Trichonephila inaurata madagascariensis TaxID=2747483 RepID=A0A8X6MIN7_9ARAC|nr:hypothetical protein TNIN_409821 [Trichonephila inaurata madagascariensis]